MGRVGFECLLQHKLMAWTEKPSMSRKRATTHAIEQTQSVRWIVSGAKGLSETATVVPKAEAE